MRKGRATIDCRSLHQALKLVTKLPALNYGLQKTSPGSIAFRRGSGDTPRAGRQGPSVSLIASNPIVREQFLAVRTVAYKWRAISAGAQNQTPAGLGGSLPGVLLPTRQASWSRAM